MDFLESNRDIVCLASKSLSIQDGLISVSLIETNAGFVRCKKSVTLPPHCQVDVPVSISRCLPNTVLLLEPVPQLADKQIQGARCLVTNIRKTVYMRLLNPCDYAIHLSYRRVLATAEE